MKKRYILLLIILAILVIGFTIPQRIVMPVFGATKKDYNSNSFWYYPWGKSITHKGVDIFAEEGAKLHSSVNGLVIYSGVFRDGGNVILILGPKWRFHYYAHLKSNSVKTFSIVSKSKVIGYVGSSGNAKGKPAHLHYSIMTPFPYFWKIDNSRQGWKKMFYLNPIKYLEDGEK